MLLLQLELNHAQQWGFALWLAALGGCLGSFMNVVVYRLPRRKSLIHPGSACPQCGHAIRWQHNVPVLGWLLLGGRCRDCRAPISARYPIIEAIVAATFVALGFAGPLAGDAGTDASQSLLWGRYAWHAVLLCVLLCLALIELDGDRAGETHHPWLLVLLPVIGGMVALAYWPQLHPAPLGKDHAGAWTGLAQAALGAAAGLGLGLVVQPATGFGPMQRAGRRYAMLNALLVGLFLGWQAAALLVVATTLLYLPAARGPKQLPWSLVLWALTLLWILFDPAGTPGIADAF